MSLARGHSTKHRFCLGLAVLTVCLGCSSRFSATEKDPSGSGGVSESGGAGHSGTSDGGMHDGGTDDAGSAGSEAAGESSGGRSAGGRSAGGRSAGGRSAGGRSGGLGGNNGVGGARAGAGGAQAGGTSGSSGAAGHGGARLCDLVQCLVANTCLDKCGGMVVYTGCCACVPPSVNQLTCTGTD